MIAHRDKIRERELDMPAALICSVLANINRNEEKRPEPFTVYDFLLNGRKDSAEADPRKNEEAEEAEAAKKHNREMIHKIRWMNLMFGGKEDPALAAQWEVLS